MIPLMAYLPTKFITTDTLISKTRLFINFIYLAVVLYPCAYSDIDKFFARYTDRSSSFYGSCFNLHPTHYRVSR